MDFDLLRIWHEMDLMARGIAVTLFAMGLISLTVFVERLLTYGRSQRQSRSFAGAAAELVPSGAYAKLKEVADKHQGSHLARMLSAAIKVYLEHEKKPAKGLPVVELVRREILRQHEDMSTSIRRGLSMLASVGSTAPFVGLLGTVVGIIAAFKKIAATGSGGLASVAGGISEALVVTALGLVVAIPAVMLFNFLSNRADRLTQSLTTSAGQFIDHLEYTVGGGTHGSLASVGGKEGKHASAADIPSA